MSGWSALRPTLSPWPACASSRAISPSSASKRESEPRRARLSLTAASLSLACWLARLPDTAARATILAAQVLAGE